MPSPVDYDLAVATARRLAPAPPQVSWEEAGAVVTELRALNPDAKILIIGGYNPVPWHAQARLINEYLGLWDAALAGRFEADRNVAVVKMSDLVDEQRLSRLDRFHPGGDAYQAAAERIADLLV